jgi:hypothetical protein
VIDDDYFCRPARIVGVDHDETNELTAARVLAHTCDQLGQILDAYRRRVLARLARDRHADPF